MMESLLAAIAATSFWELIAAGLALAYLVLISRENIWGWPCALVSTLIYTLLLWHVSLLMESALNIYYMGMALYGWHSWARGGAHQGGLAHERLHAMRIQRWSPSQHLGAALFIALTTLTSGYFLAKNTQAAWPFLDSFTTWASVLTTYMVARKVLENWLYWIVIDTVAIYLYIDRELYLTALLFLTYLLICIHGFFHWRKNLQTQLGAELAAPA